MSPDDDQFISSIYNYCDRWCERCEFTPRCRVFADESTREPLSDDPMEDAILTVAQSFAEALHLLKDNAAKFGIDLDAANDPKLEKAIERQREIVDATVLVRTAKDYGFASLSLLENAETLGLDVDDLLTEDMLSMVGWYQFFIGAKLHRAYHGIVDLDGDEDVDALRDPGSDANGSAKVAQIAIDNSVLAWTYLLNDRNADVIKPLIETLETIRSQTETQFPIAREFVRPGFDEIQTVM